MQRTSSHRVLRNVTKLAEGHIGVDLAISETSCVIQTQLLLHRASKKVGMCVRKGESKCCEKGYTRDLDHQQQ